MEETILFKNVRTPLLPGDFSFSLKHGEVAVLQTSKEEDNLALVRLFLGLSLPVSGEVIVLGEPIASLGEKLLFRLRSRIGLVSATGGLISNLKVWENLMLPLQYHKLSLLPEHTAAGEAALERVGYRGGHLKLPGLLTLFENKQVLLARAMIMDPEVVIYDSLHLGLNARERNQLVDIAVDFHRERDKRTSIFLSPDASFSSQIQGATLVSVN